MGAPRGQLAKQEQHSLIVIVDLCNYADKKETCTQPNWKTLLLVESTVCTVSSFCSVILLCKVRMEVQDQVKRLCGSVIREESRASTGLAVTSESCRKL